MANIIKLLITLALFYYLSRYVDFTQLHTHFLSLHPIWIVIALIFQMGSTYLAAYRWFKISQLLIFKEPLSFYVQSYFKGTFFNQVLPSSIGGDAIRILDLSQKGYDKKDALYGVFVDRVVGLVGLLILNLFATIIFYGTFDKDFSMLIILIALGGISGFFSLFYLEKIKFLSKIEHSVSSSSWYRENFKQLLHDQTLISFYLLGMLNGILPCGFVYFFAITAASTGSFYSGGFVMLIFGLSTIPALFSLGFFVSLFKQTKLRNIMIKLASISVLIYGGYTLYNGYTYLAKPNKTLLQCHT